MENTPWADLHVSGWAGTKRSLHLYTQMLGKIRVALSPTQPNWMHTALYLNARGLTTGFVPYGDGSIEASIDVFSSAIVVSHSSGETRTVPLLPPRCVADVYAELSSALAQLSVSCVISVVPQEVPDTTPLFEDRTPATYDPEAVIRWFDAMTAIAGIFDQWRAHFFGRSGIQVWWGAFDLALILFNGKKVAPPTDRGYIMKYDLDAELLNVGLYLGDENNAPFFYGYIYPQPLKAETLSMTPLGATWSTALREWILPYDGVRTAHDPGSELRAFLDRLYEVCGTVGGWDVASLSYDVPKRRTRGARKAGAPGS